MSRARTAAILLLCASPGAANEALSFAPTQMVQVASSPSLDSISGAITVEMWARVTDPGAGQLTALRRNLTGIVNAGEVVLLRMESFDFFANVMHPRFRLRVGPDSFFAEGTVPISFDTWHHWAATFDGTFMRMYWDGALIAIVPHPGAIAATDAPLLLGAGVGSPFDSWRGELDEVRIWNVARTQAQIQGSMFSALSGSEAGLLAYWRFEEGGGQFATDSTANGNAGILGLLPVADFADPTRVSLPLIGLSSVSPAFGAFYGPSPVTLTGTGFGAAGAPAVSVGGIAASAVTVLGPTTIQATFPPGPPGLADVTVLNGLGSATLPGAWVWADHLHAETSTIPLATGGSAPLRLFAEPASAGLGHLVLSCTSGTVPGFPVPGTPFTLPLNPDPWMLLALGTANSPIFANFLGILDAEGEALAVFDTGPGPLPGAVTGLAIHFAYVVIDPSGGGSIPLVSNPVTVTILP